MALETNMQEFLEDQLDLEETLSALIDDTNYPVRQMAMAESQDVETSDTEDTLELHPSTPKHCRTDILRARFVQRDRLDKISAYLCDFKIVASAWMVQLGDHKYLNELKTDIENWCTDIAFWASEVDHYMQGKLREETSMFEMVTYMETYSMSDAWR